MSEVERQRCRLLSSAMLQTIILRETTSCVTRRVIGVILFGS